MAVNSYELDILKELCNIGTAHAATALAKLLGQKIEIDVPVTKIIKKDVLIKQSPQKHEYLAVEFTILGEVTGKNLFFIKNNQRPYLVERLLNTTVDNVDEMNLISTVQEIGNILSANFLAAIGDMLNLLMIPSVPQTGKGSFNGILGNVLGNDPLVGDEIIIVRTKMKNDNLTFTPFYVFAPFKKGLEIIFNKMRKL